MYYNPPAISAPPYYTMTLYDKMKNTKAPSDCVKIVIAMKIVGVDDPVHPRADRVVCPYYLR